MQLALFVVIVAFVHLSCELQSVSCWYVDESLKNIGGECENQLLEEVLNKCSEQGGGFTLAAFHGCSFVCQQTSTNGGIQSKITVNKTLKNGIPCGKLGGTCLKGQCVDACNVKFVNA
uniref:Putative conserved secreted protein n=1 Tax=Ixodes ricinus TaxID=34613 RepID=A0A6B0UM57_IXORI